MQKGEEGHVYDTGGKNELTNVEVSRHLLKIFGLDN
jgi:dTDP-D-glucose 4,6-dehydratase